MSVEQSVSSHYTRGKLEEKIFAALKAAGKDMDRLQPSDFSMVDNLHVGGRDATESLAQFMDLQPGMHLLDVGCGIGGPARYFAEQGYRVTGIDLTTDFVQMAASITRVVKLDGHATFQQGSALEMPFSDASFDRAYMIHVGMNIEDKARMFREVARVLKPGGRFATFDIVRNRDGEFEFPMPWANTPATSFVAGIHDYRQALQAAGFRIVHERDRTQFALEVTRKMMERAATAASPVHGVQVLMGEQMPLMVKNVTAAMASEVLAPVELVGTLG